LREEVLHVPLDALLGQIAHGVGGLGSQVPCELGAVLTVGLHFLGLSVIVHEIGRLGRQFSSHLTELGIIRILRRRRSIAPDTLRVSIPKRIQSKGLPLSRLAELAQGICKDALMIDS